jgi:hypothetical protein
MTKKILLILGILIIIGVAAFLILSPKPQTGGGGENRVGFSIMNYLPFGGGGNNTESTSTITRTNPGETSTTTNPISNISENQPVPRLRKISNEPVAGGVIWNIGTASVVRFVEKGTGNVYEARSNTVNIQRLTNTTIPKIVRAFWLPDGSGFLAQTLIPDSDIIETNFVKLNKNKASSTVENMTPFSTTISKLPTGIKEIAINQSGTKIFYYTINGSYSNWYTANPDGTKSSLLFTHPLTEWLPFWISGNTVVMQNKGSYGNVGFTYSFDVTNKTLKKTGLGVLGISSNTNSDGSLDLVSSGGSFPELNLVSNKTASSTKISVNTLAEKCVWIPKSKSPSVYCAVPNQIPNGNYPDSWYKGTVATDDFIEKLDINNGVFYKVIDLSSVSNQQMDVMKMLLSPDETHLIFRNKIDGYLWMLRIGEKS